MTADNWLRVTFARPEPDLRRAMSCNPDGFLVQVLEFAARTDVRAMQTSMDILAEAVANDNTDWIAGLPTDVGLHEGWICVRSLSNPYENPVAWWEPVSSEARPTARTETSDRRAGPPKDGGERA